MYSQVTLIGVDVIWDALTFVSLPGEGLGQRRPKVHIARMGRHSSNDVHDVTAEPAAEAWVVVDHHIQPEVKEI